VEGAEAFLHAKFHLDPSNCLATIHQRHRQRDNRLIANGRPKIKKKITTYQFKNYQFQNKKNIRMIVFTI